MIQFVTILSFDATAYRFDVDKVRSNLTAHFTARTSALRTDFAAGESFHCDVAVQGVADRSPANQTVLLTCSIAWKLEAGLITGRRLAAEHDHYLHH